MNLGERLKFIRKEKGLTQAQVAKAMGASQQFINKLENKKGIKETAKVLELAKVLGVPPRWLAYGEGMFDDAADELPAGNIPLLNFDEIIEWVTKDNPSLEMSPLKRNFIFNPFFEKKNIQKAFSVNIQNENNSLLFSNSPIFNINPIMLFAPVKKCKSGDYVIARKANENILTFRQIIKDMDKLFLKSFNQLPPVEATEFQIIAVAFGGVFYLA
jgi:transcriptional regulator with XRE-family HTH domain